MATRVARRRADPRIDVAAAIVALVLLIPGIVWLVVDRDLATNAAVYLGAAGLIALFYMGWLWKDRFWAWFFGLLAAAGIPGLLLLAAPFAPDTAADALRGWILVYTAGALGGLVLELTVGRGRLELPSVSPREKATPPPALHPDNPDPAADADPPAADEPAAQESDFAPYGTRLDLGFLARMILGGLAAAAFTVLFQSVSDNFSVDSLGAQARQLDTLAWAVVIGVSAPAVWRAAKSLVDGKIAGLKGAFDQATGAATDDLAGAKQTIEESQADADPSSNVVTISSVDIESDRDLHKRLARETSHEGIADILRDGLPRHAIANVRPVDQTKIAEALGRLESAQANLQRLRRRHLSG